MREWVTDWFLRHKNDPFFFTRFKIVLFHTLSGIIVVAIAAALIEYSQRVTLGAMLSSFSDAMDGSLETNAFAAANETLHTAEIIAFLAMLLISIGIGLIASRNALRPVNEALALQRRFVANIAHELRTPLAVLKTQCEVAKLDAPSTTVIETLDESIREVDHMTDILNNLLLFNRVDAFESITFGRVDLSGLIVRITEQLRELAVKKGVSFDVERAELPLVYGNERALEQVFFNVIENAITYTPTGGSIQVRPDSITEKDVTVVVSDNGIGIQKKDLPHIFEPFYKSESGDEAARRTGLGLAIVFEIIKLHNGKIRVESTEVAGTHVYLTIPREPLLSIARRQKSQVEIAYDFSNR